MLIFSSPGDCSGVEWDVLPYRYCSDSFNICIIHGLATSFELQTQYGHPSDQLIFCSVAPVNVGVYSRKVKRDN